MNINIININFGTNNEQQPAGITGNLGLHYANALREERIRMPEKRIEQVLLEKKQIKAILDQLDRFRHSNNH